MAETKGATMQKLPEISEMDLAALLCSRVCHDVISPVGAIANGLELLDEGSDEETAEIAMDLIRSSATNASAKLQFARIAFGAAGSAGAHIDTGDAESVANAFIDTEKKIELEWSGERLLLPKNQVKLLLNMILLGIGAIPRGGNIKAEFTNTDDKFSARITSKGDNARVPPAFMNLLNGTFDESIDAHAIQPIYAIKLAQASNMELTAVVDGEQVVFEARA